MSRMRRSLRFLSSCSSSSFIFIAGVSFGFIELEEVARHAAQDHTFEAVHVVEAVTGGFVDGGAHGGAGIVADHTEQLAQGHDTELALTENRDISGQFGGRFE